MQSRTNAISLAELAENRGLVLAVSPSYLLPLDLLVRRSLLRVHGVGTLLS